MVVTTSYDLVEKLNILLQNYTIDYEEYFNRAMVGCNSAITVFEPESINFQRNVYDGQNNGACNRPTNYGNGIYKMKNPYYTTYVSDKSHHVLYWCSTASTYQSFPVPSTNNDVILIFPIGEGLFCYAPFLNEFVTDGNTENNYFWQPYWAYKSQFIDVKDDVDDKPWAVGDDDDTDLWSWPVAILDNANVKELYLISKDKKTRIFIRNKLVETIDVNGDNQITLPQEKHFVLQMLQLKAFDAGTLHDLSQTDGDTNPGVYDGTIDTWACDASAWYVCRWQAVGGWVFSEYKLPLDNEDGWVNLTNNAVSIISWNMKIMPVKDPTLAWAEPTMQINPFITLTMKTGIYGKAWWSKIGKENMEIIDYDLQTSFNIKSNY